MTEIAFHFNIPQRDRYLCQLLRKATDKGHRVVVLAPQAQHAALQAALHALDAEAFIPACGADALPGVRQRSQVVFSETAVFADNQTETQHCDVLVNLLDDVSTGFERYRRLIELVDERNREAARNRWRYYSHRGYSMERFDLRRMRSRTRPAPP